MKTNSLIRDIKRLFKQNPGLGKIIILLFLLIGIQFYYLYSENQKLKNDLSSANNKISKLKDDLSESREVITSLSQYFEEKGNITIAGLVETVYELEDTVNLMNSNVDVANNNYNKMNSNFDNLNSRTSELERRLQLIVDYLTR